MEWVSPSLSRARHMSESIDINACTTLMCPFADAKCRASVVKRPKLQQDMDLFCHGFFMPTQCSHMQRTPTEAAKDFVRGVLRRNPDLADVLDSSQCLPLHLASVKGHVEVVKALISVDLNMCFARDKDGKNALHLAVMKGKVDVLNVCVQANSQAAEVVMD
ncbi:Ankyrin repeat-containing protein ITN1 [Camellia lanceoleosa]|uniref:Ankyrin repeat-containing protein ITN1 n=1 Tax=Camellia lanceoleosa TaxID=1840588 RepID=A0ACC0G5Z2_9ERIC|nr:Ankyrin repeat-containing protein ITN1 [Camellia lanceoleosa]